MWRLKSAFASDYAKWGRALLAGFMVLLSGYLIDIHSLLEEKHQLQDKIFQVKNVPHSKELPPQNLSMTEVIFEILDYLRETNIKLKEIKKNIKKKSARIECTGSRKEMGRFMKYLLRLPLAIEDFVYEHNGESGFDFIINIKSDYVTKAVLKRMGIEPIFCELAGKRAPEEDIRIHSIKAMDLVGIIKNELASFAVLSLPSGKTFEVVVDQVIGYEQARVHSITKEAIELELENGEIWHSAVSE